MSSGLPTIHTFWHGPPLSRLERLCLSSFVAHGHAVNLYVYEVPAGVPAGVQVCDASEVLPRDTLFEHRKRRSVGMFSDWFRYRLLYLKGGIWVDMDVVCLRPFDVYAGRDELFAWQDAASINCAVLGFTAGHPLAKWLDECIAQPNRVLPYDGVRIRLRKWRRRVLQGNRRSDMRWGESGPKALTGAATYFGYAQRALPAWHFYPVPFGEWRSIFRADAATLAPLIAESSAIHLWNEMVRQTPGFDRDAGPSNSLYEMLCRRYLTSDA